MVQNIQWNLWARPNCCRRALLGGLGQDGGGWRNYCLLGEDEKDEQLSLQLLLSSIYSEVMVKFNKRMQGNRWRAERHDVLISSLLFPSMRTHWGQRRSWLSLLHSLLVLLICTHILTSLFALLAPLALLVFVSPVAVALLAVVSPSTAAAARIRRRTEWNKGKRQEEGREIRDGQR